MAEEPGDLCLNGYYANGNIKNTIEPDSVSQIRSYSSLLPKQILDTAVEIYYQIDRTEVGKETKLRITPKILKGGKKQRRIYICLYLSLVNHNMSVDPNYVAKMINMKESFISKAFNENPVQVCIKPDNMFNFYLIQIDRLDLRAHCLTILERLRSCQLGRELIDNYSVKGIVTGIINQILMPNCKGMQELSKRWFASTACLKRYQTEVRNCLQPQEQFKLEFWWNESHAPEAEILSN